MKLLPYDADALLAPCRELDGWRERIDFRGPLPRRWAGRLRRELEAEAIAASTSMEGVPVTVEEVRRILAGDAPKEVKEEDRELVEGYREAMSFVLRRADDPAFRWNRELIVGLHDRIMAGRHSEGAGRLRTERPVFIVNRQSGEQVFLPSHGEEVPELLDEACSVMDTHPHPAIAAAWIHVAVAAIHPFGDGNGRVARVSASLAMYRGGFKRPEFTSLEEWWGRHLNDYYGAFESLGDRFDREADVTPFLRAHLLAQTSQIRVLHTRQQVEQHIWTALEQVAEESGLDQRVANALWDAFFGRTVTAGYYRSIADVSRATATNDLRAAVAARLLEAHGERRGRRYVTGERLHESAGGILFIEVSGTPEFARDLILSDLTERLRKTGEAFGFDPWE